MRFAFERAKVGKAELLKCLEGEQTGTFLGIEEAHKRLAEFCKEKKVALPSRDGWVIFLNLDKTKGKQFKAENIARTIFEETEKEFLERHVRGNAFVSPPVIKGTSGVRGSQKRTPAVISELEVRKYDQKKTHWKMFKGIDGDGDGTVSSEELLRYVEGMSGRQLGEAGEREVLDHFGVSSNGYIGFADFYSRLYQNVGNAHLMEKENVSNILQSKQFDNRQYKEGFPAVKQAIEGFKDQFRLHKDDNRRLSRLLHSRQVQVHPGLPEHLRQPPAAAH